MSWSHDKLKELLKERGVTLLTPAGHRDRWLEGVARERFRLTLQLTKKDEPVPLIETGLDVAAGVLIELPRLEADAWAGWKDPRLSPALRLLATSELPEAPPRVALAGCWSELRGKVPFTLERPKVGESPQPLEELLNTIADYLSEVWAAAETVLERKDGDPGADPLSPPIPRDLLRDRLLLEVERHIAFVRQRVVPMARDLYWAAFPSQRSATMMQRARGEEDRLDEGRRLRVRGKHRYHLAAWVLREAGLTRLEIGLFMHFIDPREMQTTLEDPKSENLVPRLEKEVENSLAYWRIGAGESGNPKVQIGNIEFEIRDLLRPA